MTAERRTRPPRDVVALIFGLLLTSVAVGALWRAYIGPIDWATVKIFAPIGLIAAGIGGLALSRHRS